MIINEGSGMVLGTNNGNLIQVSAKGIKRQAWKIVFNNNTVDEDDNTDEDNIDIGCGSILSKL